MSRDYLLFRKDIIECADKVLRYTDRFLQEEWLAHEMALA